MGDQCRKCDKRESADNSKVCEKCEAELWGEERIEVQRR